MAAVGLPGIDGYEWRSTTLVALTGYGLPEDCERALAAGFDVHLVKPVDLLRLSELLAG